MPGEAAAPDDPLLRRETDLCRLRRQALGLPRQDGPHVGLALSGGGIRSATFALGLLQAMSRTGALREVDYLSTVSGGGYTGAFLGALLRAHADHEKRAPAAALRAGYALADRVLQSGASAREIDLSGAVDSQDGRTGTGGLIFNPVRWLRENGRYLTPTRNGDWMYAGAYWLRSLVGVHYVGAVTLLLSFGTLAWLAGSPGTQVPQSSPLWPWAALAAATMVALTLAYWVSAARPYTPGQRVDFVLAKLALPVACVAAFVMAGRFGARVPHDAQALRAALARLRAASDPGVILQAAGVLCLVAMIAYAASGWNPDRVELSRRRLTGWLSVALRALLALLAAAAVDTLARWLVRIDVRIGWTLPSATATLAALGALLRWLHPTRRSALQASGRRWLAPLALLVAMALCAALATAYAFVAYAAARLADARVFWTVQIFCAAAFALLLAQPSFLNLSTFHNFYAARLTRAYLGAANLARLSQQQDGVLAERAWVSESHPGDLWTLSAYYGSSPQGRSAAGPNAAGAAAALCPVHLVNVTLNERRGGTSNIAQQDRKGVPMSVGPAGVTVGGRTFAWSLALPGRGTRTLLDAMRSMKLGNWIAVSGAAVSTGVGAETRLGPAMLATLLNARLGYWWSAPAVLREPPGAGWRTRALQWWRANTIACLAAEMTGGFWGRHSARWYLSDGGHFENTAAYELIRRRVPLIVVSDNGADPDYGFADLANLVRKARLDLGAEIEVLEAAEARALVAPALARLFGAPGDFGPARGGGPDAGADAARRPMPCALLARVRFADRAEPPLTLLVIKPALAPGLPADVVRYAQSSPRFPQEPTADQFFDEAQWESYRRLGEAVGGALFAAQPDGQGWAPAGLRPLPDRRAGPTA